MEPIAIAARTDAEIWVVNHLSDSISIVDLSGPVPRVARTLLVCDEPRDIVFAGPGGTRAFITTAHRGQNSGVPNADLTTEREPARDDHTERHGRRAEQAAFHHGRPHAAQPGQRQHQ
jgi:hypothetical protein